MHILIKKIIEKGKDNFTFFVPLRPLRHYGFISMTTSRDKEEMVECRIVEDNYKLSDGYKIEFVALDENFGGRTFYQSDFVAFVEAGAIIIKEK